MSPNEYGVKEIGLKKLIGLKKIRAKKFGVKKIFESYGQMFLG